MQARRTIHVAERSTAFMGLQFNDPSYNRPMSTGGGEPRRLKSRLPGAIWAGGGLLLLLLIIFLARQIILPFLLAIFLTYLLLPLVNAMTEPGPGGRPHASGAGRIPRPRRLCGGIGGGDPRPGSLAGRRGKPPRSGPLWHGWPGAADRPPLERHLPGLAQHDLRCRCLSAQCSAVAGPGSS